MRAAPLFGLILALCLFCACTSLGPLVGAPHEQATAVAPLPQVPKGLRVRSVASFTSDDQEPVRIATHPSSNRLYVLGGGGDVFLLDTDSATKRRVLVGADYIDQPRGQKVTIPLPVDAKWVNSPITLRPLSVSV